jgi:hypothetical protein
MVDRDDLCRGGSVCGETQVWYVSGLQPRRIEAYRGVDLLLEHARITEGSSATRTASKISAPTMAQSRISFDPLFARPVVSDTPESSVHPPRKTEAVLPESNSRSSQQEDTPEAITSASTSQTSTVHRSPNSSNRVTASQSSTAPSSTATVTPTQPDQLTELINSFVDKQRTLAKSSGGSNAKSISSSDDIVSYNLSLQSSADIVLDDERGGSANPRDT